MKKLILTLILWLITTPAFADTIYINDKPHQTDTIIKDDTTYVPLRFISEQLNILVTYDGQIHLYDSGRSEENVPQLDRPFIRGAEVERIITDALNLLEQKDYNNYKMICDYVETISYIPDFTQADGQEVFMANFMNTIIVTDEIAKGNKTYGVDLYDEEYIAGLLVHEATHAKAWKEAGHFVNNEPEAYREQVKCLETINASKEQIDFAKYCQSLYGNP